ncbi:MAG: beta-lactamase family protein, partial [Chloroflexota bacterium]|nr:beta-lactamase family protein [Chloroflexota bacterium]
MPSSPTADALDAAWRVVVDGADCGAYPGAVAVVAHGDRVVVRRAVGWAAVEPDRVPMTEETVFDLASLTKTVATLPAILRLVAAGALALDDPLGAHLPAFGLAGAKRGVTIRRLLAHNAGLTAWRPLYLDHIGPAAYLAAIAVGEPSAPPGEAVVYSDLGFVLLGELVRRLSGDDVATFAAREFFAPLGMTDAGFLPPAALLPRIAATERGNRTEHGMCGPRANGFGGWRTGV